MNSFRRGNEYIHITHIPERKKPVLAIGIGNIMRIVASFNSEDNAEDFNNLLCRWLGLDTPSKK